MTMSHWDQRYSESGYAYGMSPNDFLAEQVHRLKLEGRILCLAEGEGRNAVFLARQGFKVEGVDSSAVGLAKARALADQYQVTITTIQADLTEYEIEVDAYDAIVSIFCHMPATSRKRLHQAAVDGLKSDGFLILEGYTPAQLDLGTGGPKDPGLMMNLVDIQNDFKMLNIIHGKELVRPIHEGRLHTGDGAVVQLIGQKA